MSDVDASSAAAAEKRAQRASKKALSLEDEDVGFSQRLTYQFQSCTIYIEEDWSGEGSGIAGMQWLGGVTLSRFFDDRERFPSFESRRVIEFGAGCGLTSMLLAIRGAHVTLTDIDITKAQPNIEINMSDAHQDARERLVLSRLDWSDPQLERFNLPFDMIVAGDCCYVPSVIEPLLRTMWEVSSASTEIYLCGIVSETALGIFNDAVGKYFTIERLRNERGAVELEATEAADQPSSRLRALMRLHRIEAPASTKST